MKTLTEIRENKNLTREQLAHKLGKSPQYLGKIEKTDSISLKKFAEICLVLEYSELEIMQFIAKRLSFVIELH